MGFFPETIAASLAGRKVECAALVRFDFTSAPMFLWRGFGDFTDVNGQHWMGAGELGTAEGLEQAINGQAPEATFTLSAITPEILRIARDEFATEVLGRTATVYLQFFGVNNPADPDNQRPLDAPYAIWSGRMLRPTFSYQDTGDCSLQITAESLFSLRSRPQFAMYTDADQQERFAGDLGFQFVGTLLNKVVTWPDY